MDINEQTVGVRFEDTDHGPSLTVEPEITEARQTGILRGSDLTTVEVTSGAARGSTYIWDPSEVALSPIR